MSATVFRRDGWEYPRGRLNRFDMDGITVTSGKQGLTIAVAEEKAVSSYNATIETSITLPPDVAVSFVNWLQSTVKTNG